MAKKAVPTILVVQRISVNARDLPPGVVSVGDAAKFLGVTPETVRRNLATGHIVGKKEEGTAGHERWRWVIDSAELLRVRALRKPLSHYRIA